MSQNECLYGPKETIAKILDDGKIQYEAYVVQSKDVELLMVNVIFNQ